MSHYQRANIRKQVAQEAAELLYTGQEKEFRQAKLRAAKTLGVHILPSNAEIAIENDQIAEEREGKMRQERLIQMRQEALKIMQTLENFNPLLVGSVWRGTTNRHSDIDIVTYEQNPHKIVSILQKNNYTVVKTEVQTVTKKGKKKQTFHIYVNLQLNKQAEIVVHNPENINCPFKCEIYGDIVTGLNIKQLQKILRENPKQKFVPT